MVVAPVRVLVVDDSALMRHLIADILSADPEIEVVGTARHGLDALGKVESLGPSVIALDLLMPGMSGLESLRRLMAERPTPVVILTGVRDARRILEALEQGAVDFVLKPSGPISPDIGKVGEELIAKVKRAAQVNLWEMLRTLQQGAHSRHPLGHAAGHIQHAPIVAVGASTGGPQALRVVLSGIPRGFGASVVMVQHIPASFTRGFARRIGRLTSLPTKEAEDGEVLEPGVIYVAPGGSHTTVVQEAAGSIPHVALDHGPPVNGVRPSVDVLFTSLARLDGCPVIGVVLTGMGTDGAEGIRQLKKAGALTLAQDAPSSAVFGMPRAAAETGAVDYVLPLREIPAMLVRLVQGT